MKPAIRVIVDRNIESYREWSERRLKAEQDAGTVKTTLFHFTSYAGLRGILDNSNIRLTHYSFQNDPTEFVRGTRIATDCIADVAAAADFGPIHDLSSCIGDLLGNPENMDFWTSYVACFTHNVNDIGQWRTYGKDGQGCAIGFSKEMFKTDSDDLQPVEKRVFVGRLRYPGRRLPPRFRDPMAVIAQTLSNAVSEIGEAVRGDQAAQWEIIREFANEVIAEPTMWSALTTKHPGYKPERETRLAMIGLKGEYDAVQQVNERGTSFVPYAFDRTKMVMKIMLGPDSADGAINEVKGYLARIGLSHVPVLKSALPYRSLDDARITLDDVRNALR